jgi:hypothetical protein
MPTEETGFEPDGPPAELLEEYRELQASVNGSGQPREDQEADDMPANIPGAAAEALETARRTCRLCDAAPGVLLAALGLGLLYVGVDLAGGGWLSRRLAGRAPEQESDSGTDPD